MSTELTYTIGKVVSRLQHTYPDLSVSKVRFLEAEGLVNPKRTKSGYRLYSEADIERLETILQLQKTHFYPLAVIKEKLSAHDSGAPVSEIDAPNESARETAFMQESHSIEEMADFSGATPSFVKELIDAGFLDVARDPMGRLSLNGRDLPLVRSAYELNSYGLDVRYLKSHLQRVNRDVPFYKQALAIWAKKNQESQESPLQALEHIMSLNNAVSNTLLTRMLGM